MRRTRLLTAGTVLAAVLAVGGIAVAVLDRPVHADDHAHLDLDSGLLVTGRTALRLCVESGTRDVGPRLVEALDEVRRDPVWRQAYGSARYSPGTVLAWGCPAPRLPDRLAKGTVAGPGAVEQPSPYRVWVYVLDDPTADRVLGPGQRSGVGTAELLRESETLFPVSTALLLRTGTDTATVTRDLKVALGLTAG